MKILLHVGVGNLDRPSRWQFINELFSDLARTFEVLGHECLLWYHDEAASSNVYRNSFSSSSVSGNPLVKAKKFNPDWVFTWNGNSEGDIEIINQFGKDKMVYAELGFFDHYETVFFDFNGVNGNSENLYEELSPFDESIYKKIVKKHKKKRLKKGRYIFVPLQDESDTNITLHSPIKKMDEVLQYIQDNIAIDEGVEVLFKKHPLAKCETKTRKDFVEVTENVHHYLPYAEQIIGVNSTVLLEGLIYTKNVITLGKGITSRDFKENENKQFITHLINKQFYWDELKNIDTIENSIFYKKMVESK